VMRPSVNTHGELSLAKANDTRTGVGRVRRVGGGASVLRGHAVRVHIGFGVRRRHRQSVLIDRVAGDGPRAQARQVGAGQPQARVGPAGRRKRASRPKFRTSLWLHRASHTSRREYPPRRQTSHTRCRSRWAD
jgi:hypothetical protein